VNPLTNPYLDTRRHDELFNADAFNTPVTVIGAGATGSWLVLQLAKLGITDITVWDFDHVEAHNVPNQLFGLADVGKSKVQALQHIVAEQTGMQINIKHERYENQPLSGYVFCMIDTMEGRKSIWHNAIKYKSLVKHYIEPRMGMDVARIYNLKPMDVQSHTPYEDTLYGDDVAEVSACGTSMTVITSALVTSAWCVRQLIEVEKGRNVSHEILIDLQNNQIYPTTWS
jgi:hypothetical protein